MTLDGTGGTCYQGGRLFKGKVGLKREAREDYLFRMGKRLHL